MGRIIILVTLFAILTALTVIHMYISYQKILEMPENIPDPDQELSKGFWMNFGMVHYFNPLKTISLTFGFYVLTLFLIDYFFNKRWKNSKKI